MSEKCLTFSFKLFSGSIAFIIFAHLSETLEGIVLKIVINSLVYFILTTRPV